jgi:hypothetical protein
LDAEWNLKYTNEALIEELALLERHYRDGSWNVCSCVPEKHLPLIAGLASEGLMFLEAAENPAERERMKVFYENLADVARKARLSIDEGTYSYFPSNPGRAYLPHGLTEEEKASPSIRHKLSRCIKEAEQKYCGNPSDYSTCTYNPVAVCRSSIEKHG